MMALVPENDFLIALRERLKSGGTVAFLNGCFDALHEGHLRCIIKAAEVASQVVIAVNDDAYILSQKKRQPMNNSIERVGALMQNEHVREAFVFSDPDPVRLIAMLKPDFVVKGPDYRGVALPEQQAIDEVGARLVICEDIKTISSTQIYEGFHNKP